MADSALPPPPLTPPSQLFSFTDWSISHPQAPPPGDRLDAQFNEVTRAIQILIERLKFLTRDDGQLTNYSVGLNSLDQGLAALIVQGQQPLIPPPDINQAINDAYAARDAVQASRQAIEAIAYDVANHVIDAAQANDKAQEALLAAADARNAAIAIANQFPAAQAELNALLSSDIRTTSSATDAEQLAWKWAEKLDGPVLTEAEYAAIDPALKPPGYQYNPVGGVNGLWSSHWWSIQARDAVGDASSEADRAEAAADDAAAALDQFTDLYLGPHPANPTLDNDGNPLQVGAVYYNTNDGNMYVWSGTQWTVSSSAKGWVPEAPIDSHTYVRGNASWLLSAGGIGEAPNNGNAYARKSVAWSQLNSNDVVFDTGPMMVTGAVNLKADQTALITETNARIAGDQANIASINNLKASGVANDSSVVGATVKDALNTNLGAINANAAAVALKADAAATNAALALKANIASPVFTGDPQAPTPAPGDNDTSIPTTAWVNTAVSGALALKPSVIVSAAAPASPIDNAMWWESDTGYLFLRYNDGNSAQWVQLNGIPTALQANYVAKAGDTMTGNLVVSPGSGGASLVLNKPASGSSNFLQGQTAGKTRWNVVPGNNNAETGTGNAGSDFVITRFDDSGTYIDTPLSISRATGVATFGSSMLIAPPGNAALTLAPVNGSTTITLNRTSPTQQNAIAGQNNSVSRWVMLLGNATPESGGNVGADFYLQRFADNGTVIDNCMNITRSAGAVSFTGTVTTPKAGSFASLTLTNLGSASWYYAVANIMTLSNNAPNNSNIQLDNGAQFLFNSSTTGGAFKAGGGSWAALSDERIKIVQADYQLGLAEVLALRPVVYTYKGNDKAPDQDGLAMHQHAAETSKPFVGLVAQEAEQVFPGMVSQQAGWIDGKPVTDLRTLDNAELVYALVNAVKELSARIATLEATP